MTTAIVIAVVLLLLAPIVGTALIVEDWGRDLSTNRATSDPDSDTPLMRSITQRFTVEQLDGVLEKLCRDEPAWSMDESPKPLPDDSPFAGLADTVAVRHLVRRTRVLGFRDDVWLVVTPAPEDYTDDEERLRLNIESRSRVGVGDLGQNPRNIRELNRLLVSRLIVGAPSPVTR